MLRYNTDQWVPVKLYTSLGLPATGIVAADVWDGFLAETVTLIDQDGAGVPAIHSITLVDGTNWRETDSTRAPGVYHLLVPDTLATKVGPVQISILPLAASPKFVGTLVSTFVESVATDVELLRDYEEGKWKIHTSGIYANQLVYYDPSGAIIKRFRLYDAAGLATTTNPFERDPV